MNEGAREINRLKIEEWNFGLFWRKFHKSFSGWFFAPIWVETHSIDSIRGKSSLSKKGLWNFVQKKKRIKFHSFISCLKFKFSILHEIDEKISPSRRSRSRPALPSRSPGRPFGRTPAPLPRENQDSHGRRRSDASARGRKSGALSIGALWYLDAAT